MTELEQLKNKFEDLRQRYHLSERNLIREHRMRLAAEEKLKDVKRLRLGLAA